MVRLEVNCRFWRRANAFKALNVRFERKTEHTIYRKISLIMLGPLMLKRYAISFH